CERRSADFLAGRVEEQDRITRKIVLFGTFGHGFEGQRSAGIGFLGRNRQAQGDREKNGFPTIHGLSSLSGKCFSPVASERAHIAFSPTAGRVGGPPGRPTPR